MIDDGLYGTRNKRGDWKPSAVREYAPLWSWPARPVALAKWLVRWDGYLFPWNFAWGAIAVLVWLFLTPSLSTMETFEPGWILYLLAVNASLLTLTVSFFHVPLYVKRRQGTAFKYNGRWPFKNSAFLFGNQTIDNLIWSAGGVLIWTAYEAVTFWAFANGVIPYVSFSAHPIYCVALLLLIPVVHELHFYLIHRLIHIPFLYRAAHKVHHNNVNPGPWSGLSMHPIEHLLYFSNVLLFWIIPANPVHAMFMLVRGGISPSVAHTGFGKIVVNDEKLLDVESYHHYLHHKFFECNYGSTLVPFDKLFDTDHDGSDESEKRMNERFKRNVAKQGVKNRW